jgi:TIR domain
VPRMETVFVSYSHGDAHIADRLVMDLRESEVPATYDKWLLRVGDSIIEKIADTVLDSDRIIALLSPTSVNSNWVKKELSFAMTGEIGRRDVKVLPALVEDCEVPAMLRDKLYADFRISYYQGLRQLLQALCPEFYKRNEYIGQEQIECAAQELQALLPSNNRDALRKWFAVNGYALAALFGRLWHVSEAIPEVTLGNETADFVIINGQSGRYDVSLILLGDPTWSRVENSELLRATERLEGLLRWCRDHESTVRRCLALRMASTYGAEQIAPSEGESRSRSHTEYHLEVDAKLLCGRREEYGRKENELRNQIYQRTGHAVDVVSYDRVVEALSKIKRLWW